MPVRVVRRKPATSELRKFASISKNETRLLGNIQRMLMEPRDDPRDDRVLHVSEMTKVDWCQRRAYYRISGAKPSNVVTTPVLQLEAIWEAGNEIDRKWKLWTHMLGKLRGRWNCPHCDITWQDTSPKACPACGCRLSISDYQEVPIWSEEHQLEGHADGDVDEGNADITDDPLFETKSIGVGTLRMEAPQALRQHTHKIEVDGEEKTWVDLEGLWRGIRRPFPSHLKQGATYGYLLGRKHVIFIYEYKPTQAHKEFVIRVRREMVEDLLEEALDLRYAAKKGKVPLRAAWATLDAKACKTCPFRDTCWSIDKEHDEGQRRVRAPEGGDRRRSATPERRVVARREAEVPSPTPADADSGRGRRRPDGPVRAVRTVGRSPERPVSSGDGGGASRRGSARYRRSDSTRR